MVENKNRYILGILGGGQLGMMLCDAAKILGIKTLIYAPKSSEKLPAEYSADEVILANYDDENKLLEFANKCDFITLEFENIPVETIKFLENLKPVSPPSRAVYIAQNRSREKNFFNQNNLPTNNFKDVRKAKDIISFLDNNKLDRAIIKTASFGYDGKGQIRISKGDDIQDLWDKSAFTHAIIEEFVPFEKEISVIIARSNNGNISTFPIGENEHKNGILDKSTIPAEIENSTKIQAVKIAEKIANKLGYVGVLAVEFFVLKNGEVLINEIAPRVHNSGHWSLDGCQTSQFEQHIRAVCGLNFGSIELLHKQIIMQNIIGEDYSKLDEYKSRLNNFIHDYNKKEIKSGRKLAHVNIITQ